MLKTNMNGKEHFPKASYLEAPFSYILARLLTHIHLFTH